MTGYVVIMVVCLLLMGALLAVTPSLMPPTECFAVSVPPSAQQDPRIRALKCSYARTVVVTTVVCMLLLALVSVLVGEDGLHSSLYLAATIAVTFVPMVVGFVLMLRNRAQVRELKRVEQWAASSSRAVAFVGEGECEGAVPLAWNLLYLPLVVALVLFGVLSYDRFPELIPMQCEFDGTVTRYVPKSLGSVLMPAILVGFMGLLFLFTHWAIIRSKRPIDPASPATSAMAYDGFVHMQSLVLFVGGLAISVAIGVAFNLSSLEIISLSAAAILVGVVAIAFALAEAWVGIALGQSGSRLAAQLRTTDELAYDDDAHWPLGMIYFNADDASVIVPKRFGIGWTLNMARPATWVIAALLVVVTAAFAVLTTVLVG